MVNKRFRSRIVGLVTASLLMVTTVGGVAVENANAASKKLTGELKLSGSTTVLPLAQLLATAFMKQNKGVKITVAGGGSGVGISDVIAGKVNIGNASRDLTDAEKKAGAVEYNICRDAVAIVVNTKNKVKGLTTDQVAQIYAGKITNWNQVGGANAPIILQSRTSPSGTLDYFNEHFMTPRKLTIAATAKANASNGLVQQNVKSNANAIGFVGLAYLKGVKGVALDGQVPSVANANKGKYKLIRFLHMDTKGKATGLAKAFIDFARSKAGQKIATSAQGQELALLKGQ
jgi:phosphate transport system substrate-binding protein